MNTNSKSGTANWWISMLKGLLLVIFGIWLLKSPIENLTKLSVIFGIIIIVGGLLEIGLAFSNRQSKLKWEWTLTSGILDVLFGAFLVANPSVILLIVTIVISVWLLIRGIIIIKNAINLKKIGATNYSFRLFTGILIVLLAVIFAWHPEILGITIAFWVALSFISLGIFRIILVLGYKVY